MDVSKGAAAGAGLVTSRLFSQRLDEFPSIYGVETPPPQSVPVFMGNEAVVFSGTLHRLFVLGGTTNGDSDGRAMPSTWMLNVDNNVWEHTRTDLAVAPGNVLASTFRLEDYAVYLIARTAAGTRRLLRWRAPAGEVEILATLPTEWNVFERVWLVAGTDGDLLFAGSHPAGGSPGTQAVVARILIDGEGYGSLAGMLYRSEPMLGAPRLVEDDIGVVIPHVSGAALSVIPVADLVLPRPGEEMIFN